MRILVLGCGSIGSRHARNLAALRARGLDVQPAVADVNAELAARVAAETGLDAFPGLDAALAWKPEGVIAAVPNHLHIPLAAKAVEAGAHVLVEKPLSHSREGVPAFLDRAEALGRHVFVVCNLRFHPAIKTLRDNLPRIGRPLFSRAHFGNSLLNMRPGTEYRGLYCSNRSMGGGVILDAIHEVDYLLWFLGPAAEVRARAGKLSDLDIDVEDCASLNIRHASGAMTEIHMDYLRPFKRRGCEIVGDRGMLLWQSEGKTPEVCTVRYFPLGGADWETLLHTDSLDHNQPYVELMENFLRAVRGEETPLLTGRDGYADLDATLAALESSGALAISKGDQQ